MKEQERNYVFNNLLRKHSRDIDFLQRTSRDIYYIDEVADGRYNVEIWEWTEEDKKEVLDVVKKYLDKAIKYLNQED